MDNIATLDFRTVIHCASLCACARVRRKCFSELGQEEWVEIRYNDMYGRTSGDVRSDRKNSRLWEGVQERVYFFRGRLN